jgi:ATP/maltotriose-dependent transcriptional regulator MalT
MRSQPTSIPDLLERDFELEVLTEAVARTRDRTGRGLLIEAPAGVGKSRLVAGARALARDGGR